MRRLRRSRPDSVLGVAERPPLLTCGNKMYALCSGRNMKIVVPNWHPARLNQWDGRHWSVRAKLKKEDRTLVTIYARHYEIPTADRRRRVSLHIVMAKGQRRCDPDAFWKSTL